VYLSLRKGRALFQTLVQEDTSAWQARTPNFGSGFLPCSGGQTNFTCPEGVLPADLECNLHGQTSSCAVFTRAGYSSDIRSVVGVNTTARTISFVGADTDASVGDFYIQGALELLDQEGEWAVRQGTIYFWPYSAYGSALSPNNLIITAPVTQRVFSFVGDSRLLQPVRRLHTSRYNITLTLTLIKAVAGTSD